MLPKLVVKLFTVLICICLTIFVYVCLQQGSGWMINNLMSYAKIDYKSSSAIINFGGIFLVAALTIFTILQLWFFYILYDSYIIIREKQIEHFVELSLERYAKKLQQKNGISNNNNNSVRSQATIKEEEFGEDEDNIVAMGFNDDEEKELCMQYTVI